jgi:hypothetical protein
LLQEDEAVELSKTMMGKKTKRLYDRMQHGIQAKQESVSRLVNKRDEAESNEKNTTKRKRGAAAESSADTAAAGKKQTKAPAAKKGKK